MDAEVSSGHLPVEKYDEMLGKGSFFIEMNADENGFNAQWTKAQTSLASGNALHTVARLGIDATPMEGVDSELIGSIFKEEMGGFGCDVALALGYHLEGQDHNYGPPKARLGLDDVVRVL